MNNFLKKNKTFVVGVVCTMLAQCIFAEDAKQVNVGTLALNVTESSGGLVQLIISLAYVAGIGFGVASIFKFKQHKDNPTQVPIGTPVSMLLISAALVFMPGIYQPLGQTIFGTSVSATGGGSTGSGATAIPGFGGSAATGV